MAASMSVANAAANGDLTVTFMTQKQNPISFQMK